ncbi:MAG TPA: hypothetical protein VGE51_01680 [Fontimonas sp.]
MTSFKTTLRALLVVASAGGLSACDLEGLGNGNGLNSLKLVRVTSLVDATEKFSYQCFPDQLQLQGEFDNGSIGDYTGRGSWSSSNPEIVAVSNGDIPLDGDTSTPPEVGEAVYGSGTILPKKVGVATITGTFVGLSASYEVEVKATDLSKLKISDDSLTLAPDTGRTLTVTTEIGGETIDLGSLQRASWSFEGQDEDEEIPEEDVIADIVASTGQIIGRQVGGPLIAQAIFPLCKNADGSVLRRTSAVNVAIPTKITLTREYTSAPNNELFAKTGELITSIATFANGDTQDLTGVLPLTSSNTDAVKTSAALSRQFITAAAPGTAVITATYGGDDENDEEEIPDPPKVVSSPLTINVVAGVPQSIEVTPVDRTVNAATATVYLAKGNFVLGGEPRTQMLTRDVSWTVTNPDNSAADRTKILFAANVLTTGAASGNYKVNARFENGDADIIGTTGVCVRPIDDEDTEVDESAGICPDNPDDEED